MTTQQAITLSTSATGYFTSFHTAQQQSQSSPAAKTAAVLVVHH